MRLLSWLFRPPPAPRLSWDGEWLLGSRVVWMPAHSSWYGGQIARTPDLVVWHYTATEPGTAMAMGRRRVRPRNPGSDPATSWHFTIGRGGVVYQHLPLDRVGWHAGGGDLVPDANMRSVGVELEGYGETDDSDMVQAVMDLRQALNLALPGVTHLGHSQVKSTKPDPGEAWMRIVRDN